MQKQWDKARTISFKVGDPEEEPSIQSILLKLKFKKMSEFIRTLLEFVKTEEGQEAVRTFISKTEKE